MFENKDFEFNINVSTQNYPTKKPVCGGIVRYKPQSITISDLELLQKQGKSFCYNFKDTSVTGEITAHEKTLVGFDYTNLIFYDIDKMPIPMNEYIEPLLFKPTLAYTTIFNGIDRYGGKYGIYGYRLIYALQEPVKSIEEFDAIYYAIAAANGFKQRKYSDGMNYEFDYRQVNQQYYGGGLNSVTYKTDIIYTHDDFSPYLEQGKEFKCAITANKKSSRSRKRSKSIPQQIIKRKGDAYCSEMENPFYQALFTLSPKEFITTYDEMYLNEYISSLSSPLSLSADGKYWLYPDNYQEVKRQWTINDTGKRCIRKWQIGSGRKKRMYITAQIMLFNSPNITREELIYNLAKERYYYYDNSDKNLNNDFLIEVADSALENEFTLSPCKHPHFSVNKEYASAVGMSANKAKNHIRKELKEEEVMALYDFGLSVKENLAIMKEKGIKVGKSYLYNMRKKYSGGQ